MRQIIVSITQITMLHAARYALYIGAGSAKMQNAGKTGR